MWELGSVVVAKYGAGMHAKMHSRTAGAAMGLNSELLWTLACSSCSLLVLFSEADPFASPDLAFVCVECEMDSVQQPVHDFGGRMILCFWS